MDVTLWSGIISGIFLVAVAVIEARAARDRKKTKDNQERDERRAADRAEASRLSMQMLDASLELGLATALAVERHEMNGEMKAARERANAARADYHAMQTRITARQLAKK